jgi:hypothetical protein
MPITQTVGALPQRKDWERFDHYAKLVKIIVRHDPRSCPNFWSRWGHAILHRVSLGLSRQLLPTLRSLSWSPAKTDAVVCGACFFLSASLQTLSIDFEEDAIGGLQCFVENMEYVSPAITELDISFPQTDACFTDPILSLISTNLRRTLHALPDLNHLSTDLEAFYHCLPSCPILPHLAALELGADLHGDGFGPFSNTNPTHLATPNVYIFPALEEIKGPNIRFWRLLLPFYGSLIKDITISHTFGFNLDLYQSNDDFVLLLVCISDLCPSLNTLILEDISLSGSIQTLVGAYKPLLSCKLLELVHVSLMHADFCEILSEGDLIAMAKAWPKLARLTLGGPSCYSNYNNPGRYIPPKTWSISLNVISALQEHCHNLKHLSLSLDTGIPNTSDLGPDKLPQRFKLKLMCFNNSPIEQPATLAVWLANTFPSSTQVTWTDNATPVRTQMWRDARAFATQLRTERRNMEAEWIGRIQVLHKDNTRLRAKVKRISDDHRTDE